MFSLFSRNSYNDKPTVSTSVHTNIVCDICRASPIQGTRYKCVNCPNFDMCSKCESNADNHDQSHVFLKISRPLVEEPSNEYPLLPMIKVQTTVPNYVLDKTPID